MLPAFIRRRLYIRRFGGDDPRWFVYLGQYDRRCEMGEVEDRRLRLIVEVAKPAWRAGVTYSRDEDHTLMLALGPALWVSWGRRGYDWPGREWGVRLWGDHLTVRWACDDSEMRYDGKGGQGRPKAGWYWSCSPLNAIFGKPAYKREEIAREVHTLTMPEGRYRADCVVTRSTWTRPRWPWRPFSLDLARAEIDFDPPVGIPGKGENAYDCDDDATHSVTMPLRNGSLRTTLDAFALDTLRTRQRRGGLDWQPAEGWRGVRP